MTRVLAHLILTTGLLVVETCSDAIARVTHG